MICFHFLRQFGAPWRFPSLESLLALETAWRISRPFLRQFGASDVFFPGAPACTWNSMAPLSSFSPSILCPWRFLPWSPRLHLKLHGAPLVLFSVNLAPLTFSSLDPLLALETARRISSPFFVNLAPLTFSSLKPLFAFETAWRPSRSFFRQFGAPDVFFPGAPDCTWNCMAHLFSFFRQFGAPDVFFPGAPACTWNCMAPLSLFFPSIWRLWRFLPWSPCLHLKLHGAPLILFSVNWRPWRFLPWITCLHLKLHGAPLVIFFVNLAPLTFYSLEPLLALETAWRISRPFLRQFGAPDVFFPGAPACTWNCMAHLSSFFSASIWRPWRFLPWSPCLHLKLHGASLVLFSVNLAPLTFSSLEPLLVLETTWRPSRPFLRQFGASDVFFPGAPACTWNYMAPLSSFSPSIWRAWRFLPWSPCLHLKLHGAPLVILI